MSSRAQPMSSRAQPMSSQLSAALLALADQRLPGGGHVHSGGVEQAITDRLVHDAATLAAFLERRVGTAGAVAAGLAAATAAWLSGARTTGDARAGLRRLDAEVDARTPSPAQRAASRAQGRGLLRTARAAWPAPAPALTWDDLGPRPHHPLALGCCAVAAGVDPAGAALVAAYLAVTGPATAAQRLLALDPVAVAAVTLRLGPAIERAARAGLAGCPDPPPTESPDLPPTGSPDAPPTESPDLPPTGCPDAPPTGSPDLPLAGWPDLPDDSDPLLDLLAERHAVRGDRLFAS
jgi:urease accessory protein